MRVKTFKLLMLDFIFKVPKQKCLSKRYEELIVIMFNQPTTTPNRSASTDFKMQKVTKDLLKL